MRQIDGFNIKLKYQESAKRLKIEQKKQPSLKVEFFQHLWMWFIWARKMFLSGIGTHKISNFIKTKKARESKHVALGKHLSLLSPGRGGGGYSPN